MNRDTEIRLLNLFVEKDPDTMRIDLMHPIEQGAFIYASDTHIAIRVAKERTSGDYKCKETPNFGKVFPVSNPSLTIGVKDVFKALIRANKTELTVDCPECDDEGKVEWYYKDVDGDTHTMWSECPCCHGTGRIPNGMGTAICIDNVPFIAHYLLIIHEAARLLGTTEIEITPNSVDGGVWLFSLADEVDVIIMSVYKERMKDISVAAKIKSQKS